MKKFAQELEQLKRRIVEMGTMSEAMVASASAAVIDRDLQAVGRVQAYEPELDRFQIEIDSEAIRLITVYSPIAKDLRFILMMLRINVDLERIGDQAVNNCEYLKTVSTAAPKPLHDLSTMSSIALGMLHDAVRALDLEDTAGPNRPTPTTTRRLVQRTFRDLLDTSDDADRLNRSMNLILVARSLERIADHATNICEEVIYMINSEDIRHQH
jgi:phosphate transport system protein